MVHARFRACFQHLHWTMRAGPAGGISDTMTDSKLPAANCAECPLKDCGRPVAAERKSNPRFVILDEIPWKSDMQDNRPLSGVPGLRLNKAMTSAGVSRNDAHVTCAVACYPGRALKPRELQEAITACRPRLEKELADLGDLPIVAVGTQALKALYRRDMPMVAWFGYPIDNRVFPMIHPSTVQLNLLLKDLYVELWKRVRTWLDGKLEWVWPPMHIEPTDECLQALHMLAESDVVGVDVETAGTSPQFSELMCVGVGNGKVGVSLKYPVMSPAHDAALRKVLESASVKVYHNAQHDVLTLRANGFKLGGKIEDTLLLHVAAHPGLRHNLSFATAQYFAAPRWKTEFHDESELKGMEVFTKAPGEVLRLYNAKDAVMGRLLRIPLRRIVDSDPRLVKIVENLEALSEIAMDMRWRGIKIDDNARALHRAELQAAMTELENLWATEFPAWKMGKNGCHPRLKELFFEEFKIKPLRFSKKTKGPKLDTWSLQMFRAGGGPPARAAELLLRYRKASKLMSTYVDGLKTEPDGMVHPAWSIWGPITGRWACANPNVMNIPGAKEMDFGSYKVKLPGMRDMFVSRPGHTFVAADYAKLELWIVAALAGDEKLIDAWRTGKDVHAQNGQDMFKLPKVDKNQRNFAKKFVYGANYDAQAETLWSVMVTEFPETKLTHVRRLLLGWKASHPDIFRMHTKLRQFVYENGYIEIPHSGMRVYYADEKQTVNVPIQGTAAVLANRAARTIWDKGFGSWLVIQCHDELVLEVPDDKIAEAAALLKEAMEAPLELNKRQWVFPVETKAGKNWGALKEYPPKA